MAMPDVSVEIAFTTAPDAANAAWTDVTPYVAAEKGISIVRGRTGEYSAVTPSTLSLQLRNKDGRFTPTLATGAYYPNVKRGRKIRVRTRWPNATTTPGNLIPRNTSFENALGSDWVQSNTTNALVATNPRSGAQSLQLTVTATGVQCQFRTGGTYPTSNDVPVVAGKVYSFGFYMRAFTTARPWSCWVNWQDAVGGIVGTVNGANVTAPIGSYARVVCQSVTAPAGAVVGRMYAIMSAVDAVAGEIFQSDDWMADEVTTLGTWTNVAPPIFDRFTGFIDQLPVAWPGGDDRDSEVALTATGRFARLGRRNVLRSVIEEEYLADSPIGYWTMGDPSGSTTAAPEVGLPALGPILVRVGGVGTPTVEFGNAIGPSTDGATAVKFTHPGQKDGYYLRTVTEGVTPPSTSWAYECFFSTSTLDDTVLMGLGNPTGGQGHILGIGGGGYIYARFQGVATSIDYSSGFGFNDGRTHHALANWDGINFELYVDGVQQASAPPGFAGIALNGHVTVNSGYVWTSFPTPEITFAHVAVYGAGLTSARAIMHGQAGLTGFVGELSNLRVARLARYAGVPTTDVIAETGLSTVGRQDLGGVEPVSAMQDVAFVEAGLLYETGAGKVGFHSRSHRINPTSAFTLDAALENIGGDLRFDYDDRDLVNDLTMSRTGGTGTVHATNAASILDNGTYADSSTQPFDLDNDVASAVAYRIDKYGTPTPRPPGVSVDVNAVTSAQLVSLLTADLGTNFTLTNLPAQAPSSSLSLFIEAITDTITDGTYRIELNTSSATGTAAWVLDSATLSVLGTTTILSY